MQHLHAGLRFVVVGAEIHADAALLELREILGEFLRRHHRSALAADPCRYPHPQFAFGKSTLEQCLAGLIQHVDPTRRDILAGSIDFAASLALHLADAREASILNRDISANHGLPLPSSTRPLRITRSYSLVWA